MNVKIGGRGVDDFSNDELLAWMQDVKGGYALRDDTALIWLAIIRTLDMQGPPMTVRGLFYNCENVYHVAPKTENGYQQVQRQVLEMRRAGILPYGFIADNTRWLRKPETFTGLKAYFEHGRKAYRRALWDNQRDYVQVWCEKDAIAGILLDVTEEWDVPLLVVRGYSSETFAYSSAQDIIQHGKPAFAYYFGDWDIHGLRISNDIERKLKDFGAKVHFERVAVQEWQIRVWDLPTRPAKDHDWSDCVEIDAIPANMLRSLVRDAIETHIDRTTYEQALKAEELERQTLADVMAGLGLG